MKYVKYTTLSLGGLALLLCLAFALELGGLQWKKFFAPRHEAVRREVFKQTRSFTEAKKQELIRYHHQYQKAKTEDEKEAIAATVRLAFADFDMEPLPVQLRVFLNDVLYGN